MAELSFRNIWKFFEVLLKETNEIYKKAIDFQVLLNNILLLLVSTIYNKLSRFNSFSELLSGLFAIVVLQYAIKSVISDDKNGFPALTICQLEREIFYLTVARVKNRPRIQYAFMLLFSPTFLHCRKLKHFRCFRMHYLNEWISISWY